MHNFSTLQKSRLRPRLPSQIAPPFLFISPGLSRRQIALCPAVTHNTASEKKKKKTTDKLGKSSRPQSGLLHFWKLLHGWYTKYMWYFDWSKEIWFVYLGSLKCFKIKFLNLKDVIPYLICNISSGKDSIGHCKYDMNPEDYKCLAQMHHCTVLQFGILLLNISIFNMDIKSLKLTQKWLHTYSIKQTLPSQE